MKLVVTNVRRAYNTPNEQQRTLHSTQLPIECSAGAIRLVRHHYMLLAFPVLLQRRYPSSCKPVRAPPNDVQRKARHQDEQTVNRLSIDRQHTVSTSSLDFVNKSFPNFSLLSLSLVRAHAAAPPPVTSRPLQVPSLDTSPPPASPCLPNIDINIAQPPNRPITARPLDAGRRDDVEYFPGERSRCGPRTRRYRGVECYSIPVTYPRPSQPAAVPLWAVTPCLWETHLDLGCFDILGRQRANHPKI